MPEFVRVNLLQVDFGSQSTARDPYCAVSIKKAVADTGTSTTCLFSMNAARLANDVAFGASGSGR